MHVALGREYRGCRVYQGLVLYIALEGGTGFNSRADLWGRKFLKDHAGPVPFKLLRCSIDLVKDCAALIADIKAQFADPPALIVVDTLARALAGDENKDMPAFIRATDAIRAAFNCSVIVVHHCGVAGSRPRGHTSLSGAADCEINITRSDETKIIVATITDMKDGAPAPPMMSRLEYVEMGFTSDNQPIGSCIIVAESAAAQRQRQRPKLTDREQLALDQLFEALADDGQIPQTNGHTPPNTRAVHKDKWRQRFVGIHPAENTKTRSKAFERAYVTLMKHKIIGVWEEMIWIADQAGQNQSENKGAFNDDDRF
jgi:hypothetical protein